MYDRTKVLSISSVQDGLTCLHQFWLKHVLQKAQIPVGEGARRGTIIHGLLENYAKIQRDLLASNEYANAGKVWQKIKEAIIKDANPIDHADLSELFDHIEFRYGNPPYLFPKTATHVVVEKAITIDSNGIITEDAAKAVFGLKIDLAYLDGATITMRDYKSGKLLPEWINPRKELMDDLQMRAYAGIIASNPDLFPDAEEVLIEQDWLRFEYGRKYAKIPISELQDIWNEIVGWTEPIMIAQETDEWPTKSGGYCSWCSVRNHCPEWSQELALAIRGDTEIVDYESALMWAKKLRVIKGKVAEVDAAVRKFVEDNGLLRDGDEVLDFHTSSTKTFELMEMIKVLRGHGVSRHEILEACAMSVASAEGFSTAINKRAKAQHEGDKEKIKEASVKAKALKKDVGETITKKPGTKFEWRIVE